MALSFNELCVVLGKNIKEHRESLEISRGKLVEELGRFDEQTLGEIEDGADYIELDLITLLELGELLGVEVWELLKPPRNSEVRQLKMFDE